MAWLFMLRHDTLLDSWQRQAWLNQWTRDVDKLRGTGWLRASGQAVSVQISARLRFGKLTSRSIRLRSARGRACAAALELQG